MIWVDESAVIPDNFKGSVLSIGKFDGVHLGHQALACGTRKIADQLGRKAMAVTFEPPPLAILKPELVLPAPLTPIDRKVNLLKHYGFDEVAVFRTGTWLLELEARAFFDRIVLHCFSAGGLVEGPDFSFGKGRSGNSQSLKSWCNAAGMSFNTVSDVDLAGVRITSSEIRRQIASGNVLTANRMMGHRHTGRGVVVRGAGRGRTIQVPTANLDQFDSLLPAPGVYAAAARLISARSAEKWWPAAVNIGEQPTFASQVQRVEAHLVGLPDRDLYGETVELAWLGHIRSTVRFESIDQLIEQIRRDIAESIQLFSLEQF